MPIEEFHLLLILEGFKMLPAQFVDLSILLGCDYVDKIRGIGPKKAIELIRQYGSIEEVLSNLDRWLFGSILF